MSRLAPWFITIAATICAVLLIFYSRDISRGLVNLFLPSQEQNKATKIVLAKTDNPNSQEVHHLDTIKASQEKPVRITFSSGWVIDLKNNSAAIAELYRPEDANSPALLSIINGEYALITAGQPGQLYIMSDKKIHSPEDAPPPQVRTLEIINLELPKDTVSATGAVALPGSQLPDKIMNQDNSTILSNNYIEQILAGQSNSLRNCQLNSVRDRKSAAGKLTMTFTINPEGKVEGVKTIQDTIKNSQLTNCAIAVIERTVFKPHTGPAVTLNYPLEFK